MNENVNHPFHYKTGKYEGIDVMCEAIRTEYVNRDVNAAKNILNEGLRIL